MEQMKKSATERARFWHEQFVLWGRSGLSQREYCVQAGLALSTFQLWRRRLRPSVPQECFDLVPVARSACIDLSPASQPVVLIIGAGPYRLEVGDGARAETVRVVLDALERH